MNGNDNNDNNNNNNNNKRLITVCLFIVVDIIWVKVDEKWKNF